MLRTSAWESYDTCLVSVKKKTTQKPKTKKNNNNKTAHPGGSEKY